MRPKNNALKWTAGQRNISDLKPAQYNPRTMTDKQRGEIEKSLDRFGTADPLIINIDNTIIGGHQRYKILKDRGDKIVAVQVPNRKLSPKEEKELNIRLNKNTGEFVLKELAEFDIALLRDIGFDSKELDKIFKTNTLPIDDDVPPLPKTPKAKRGEIYQLGNHRLMCGDSSSQEDLQKLMNGNLADIVFTDPPYGVSIGSKNKTLNSVQKAGRCLENIENDTISSAALHELLVQVFTNVKMFIAKHASLYVTAPQGGDLGLMMLTMMTESGLPVRHVLNWVKNSPTFSIGRLDYDYQHEPIFFTWNKTHKKQGGGQHKSSCWFIDKPRKSKLHPTMKPVELVENALLNSSERSDICLDVFCGSGTSLIACEKTERLCYAMELDPKYVDVIIKRWEEFSGKKAGKI